MNDIYYIQHTILAPGTPLGQISGLLEDLFINRVEADECFNNLILDEMTICKELWVKEPSGKRKILKSERKGERNNKWTSQS